MILISLHNYKVIGPSQKAASADTVQIQFATSGLKGPFADVHHG
jgi:hypothetical protein